MKYTNSMNILLLSARSDLGGGPKHMFELMDYLTKEHPETMLYSGSPLDEPFGCQISKLSHRHINLKARTFHLFDFFKLLSLCHEKKIDIIHSHGRGAGLYSRLLALFGFKVIHTFHGAHFESGLKGSFKAFIDQFLKNLTGMFICVSSSEKEKAISLNFAIEDLTNLIPNCVDKQAFNHVQAQDLREHYKIEKNKQIWGTLTRLSSEKGNHLLIDLVNQKTELFENYVFLIAGEGPDLQFLQRKNSNDNIKFIGKEDNPISFLKGLDGYFSFSFGEGLPYSVLEATSCRIPCVLSNVSGHQEFKSVAQLFNINERDRFPTFLSEAKPSNLPKEFQYPEGMEKIFLAYQQVLSS